MDVLLLEEDDLSDDDNFDGYIDGEIEDEEDDGDDGNGNDVIGMTVKMVVMSKTVTMKVLRFQSILGILVGQKTWKKKIQ